MRARSPPSAVCTPAGADRRGGAHGSFGDTAANVGILALLQSNGFLRKLPALLQTVFASAAAALFRMVLTPVDTLKTMLQAQGAGGMRILRRRVRVLAARAAESAGADRVRWGGLGVGQDIRRRLAVVRRVGDCRRDVRRALSRAC